MQAKARTVMRSLVADCVDARTGEVNFTQLAENTAHALDHDEWLDDETHWIWELAVNTATRHEKLLASKGK